MKIKKLLQKKVEDIVYNVTEIQQFSIETQLSTETQLSIETQLPIESQQLEAKTQQFPTKTIQQFPVQQRISGLGFFGKKKTFSRKIEIRKCQKKKR